MESQDLTILHVEDDPDDAELIGRELKRSGIPCRIRQVASRKDFLQALQTEQFDLILSDYTIPGFDGIAALKMAKSMSPETPFVFLSGTIGEERAVSILKQGAADYVLKDNPARLPSVIDRTIREARLARERRKAETALQETRHFIERVTEAVPDVLYVFDIVARRTLYVSGKVETVLGYKTHEIVDAGSIVPDLVHPTDLPAVEEFLAGFSRCEDDEVREIDSRLRHSAEGWRWYGIRGTVFGRDSSGAPRQILGTIRDITERREAGEQLKEQAALLEIARDAILILDLDLKIRFWNHGAENLYGWERGQILDQPHRTLCPDNDETIANVRESVLQHGDWSGEMRQKTRDGEDVIVHSRWSLAAGPESESPSILVINTDITEKKDLEKQFLRAQRLESIGAMAGGIAHDLNNILSPILMGAEILKGRTGDEDHQVVDSIMSSAQRGADLVQQVLTFARGVQGNVINVQVNQVMEEVESMAKGTFPRSIAVSCECAPDLWPVRGDVTQIHQMLLNLCVNARDAMPEGGRLHLEAKNFVVDENFAQTVREAQTGSYVAFSVSDTGSGINDTLRDQIFEPFFTTKDVGQGTGLGLATVQSLVQAHGGFIALESAVGKGTTFTIYLPAVQEEAPCKGLPKAGAETSRGNGELILVIDDETTINDIVRETLRSYGYRVMTAPNGAEGLDLFSKHAGEVAAVITDTNMPTMDGPTAVEKLRGLSPNLPILATAGFLQEEDARKFASHRVTRVLRKPFTARQLLGSLRSALDK